MIVSAESSQSSCCSDGCLHVAYVRSLHAVHLLPVDAATHVQTYLMSHAHEQLRQASQSLLAMVLVLAALDVKQSMSM